MKNLLLTIAVFSALLLIGCQENPMTDPVAFNKMDENQDSDPTRTGTIALEGLLQDPYPVMNSYFIING